MVIDTTERSFSYSFPINLPRSLIVVSAYHYRSAGRVTKGFFGQENTLHLATLFSGLDYKSNH